MAKNKQQNNNNKDDKKFYYIFFPILIITIVVCFLIYSYFENKADDTMAYNKLLDSIQKQEVEEIEMTTGSQTLKVIMKGDKKKEDRTETTNVPSLQAFMEWVNDKIDNEELDVKIVQKSPNAFLSVMGNLVAYIPTILLVVLIIMVFKMQGLGGDSGKVYGADENSKKKL